MKDKGQSGPLFPRVADARYGQLVVAPGEDAEGGPGAASGGGGPPGRGTTRGGVPRRRAGPLVTCNAARERTRVKTLRTAFHDLQQALPCVPPNTKLSKLDVLVLATMYIAHLMGTLRREALDDGEGQRGRMDGTGRPWCPEYFHPVKKWPMRTRLYAGLAARARGNPASPDPHGDMPRDLSSFL